MKFFSLIASLTVVFSLVATTEKSPVIDFSELITGGKNALAVFKDITTNPKRPVVVKCFMVNCGPCKANIVPFKNLAEQYKNKALFITVDVIKFNEIATLLKIQSAPSFFVFLPETSVRLIGSKEFNRIKSVLDNALITKSINDLLPTN